MKMLNPTRSVLLLSLVGIAVSMSVPPAQADAGGTKPLKIHATEVYKEAPLAPGTWNDAVLQEVRATRGPEDLDGYVERAGTSNIGGRFSDAGHQLVYLTSATTFDFYELQEITYASGSKGWTLLTGSYDFSTGAINGDWLTLGGTDRFAGVTGSGTFTAFNPDNTLARNIEATGRLATVGSAKH